MAVATYAAPAPGGGSSAGSVSYNPDAKVVQGNQPLAQSYVMSVKSPSNLPAASSSTITFGTSIISKSNAVDDATVLSFLSVTPASLTFTGPNQTANVTVTVNVPTGQYAGSYAYRIKPSGWPSNLTIVDEGATVNALVSPSQSTDSGPPTVTLQVPVDGTIYTYFPTSGNPLNVPIIFDATVGTGGEPITGLNAYVDGAPVSVSANGLGTLNATGTSSINNITTPGLYNVRVTATNLNGTSEDQADFTVVISAPPPTITVSSPTPNAVFSYPPGGTGAMVSVSYTATSLYGNITATGATLNGSPITLSLNGVGTSLVATGTASMQITTPGSYVLQFTAKNDYGDATPVVVPFTVQTSDPIPTVTILTPAEGEVFTRTEGDAPTNVDFTFSGGTDYGTVTAVTVKVDGEEVPATVNGLGTASITGSGSVSYSAAGSHDITVTLSNGYSTATDQSIFNVQENSVDVCAVLTWLPPIVLHKTVEGGSIVPIKFRLDCNGDFVRDETVLIAIYEVYDDNSISDPVLYPYGGPNPDEPDYAINGNHYQLNYRTAEGVHHYRVEVYKPLDGTGTNLRLLGTENILTKGKGKDCKSDKSSKSDKSGKNCKSDKSNKSSKSDKWGKSDKDDCKPGKSDKHSKSDKSSKSGKSDKSSKYGSGNPGNCKDVGGAGEKPNGDNDWGSGSKGKSDSSKNSSSGSSSSSSSNSSSSNSLWGWVSSLFRR